MALNMRFLRFKPLLGPSIKSFSLHYNVQRFSDLTCKKLKNNINLVGCCQSYVLQLHTSSISFKRRKTGEEKKINRVLEYHKVKGDVVEVWKDITAEELAKVLNKDFNYVKEIFLHEVKSPKTVISDMKFLQQGIRRSGHRMKIIAKPTDDIEVEIIEKDAFPRPPPSKSDLKSRPPVVTVMGHVDHGKTTLLDALRHSSVVDQEFGGITQHIGAFLVVLDSGAKITFLDTPGHAAFSAMRARGANLTDIVVLVVAADDGVMEQTLESVRMAREAQVPILVAINKIDSPKANIERTEQMLLEAGIHIEKLGGEVQAVPVSALKKQNLNQLTEALVLQADLLEIGADPKGLVEAVVVESKLDPHRGKLCTVIVQRGTLKKGDILVAGVCMGRVRVLRNADGQIMNEAPPGYPTEIEGWKDLPVPGELVLEVESEKMAKDVIKIRESKLEREKQEQDAVVIAEKQAYHEKEYKERLKLKRSLGRFKLKREGPRQPEIPKDDDPTPTLNIIVKSDVDGTLEAILNTLDTYDSPECKMDLVHYGVGAVSENDVELAQAFRGIIYAFNTNCPKNIQELAENSGVNIKFHNVIYKLVDDVKAEINDRLPQKEQDEVLGEATVLQHFEINDGRKKVQVAGCRCVKGVLRKSALYRVVRNGQIIHEGQLSSMRHLKNEVDLIKTDVECGLRLQDKTVVFQPGDSIICYQKVTVPQVTTWDPGF
ncbi:translation initiation factor IF-2, mitochondrial [Tribolium madens]|uniref:translation initiation factor IF-2, mitochondrial n=1 Tax=Tribolium madens TaxID=41895 RepID=UPI001CF75EB5|nr:translation initiation factor IF-2, mitochondrial [Tribolium madens]